MIVPEYIIQFIKFALVGVSNTIIYLIIYYLLLEMKVSYLFAAAFGYLFSSLWGFIVNRIWVFRAKELMIKKSIVRYYCIYMTSLLINLILMYLFVDLFNISEMIAPALVLVVTVPFNFVMNRLWVYKKEE